MDHKLIRNFSIIAHIDHGKSTLADRLIEFTSAVESRDMKSQLLDSMDIERERGITIKAQTVRLSYKADDGNTYQLNLIDTPGHVDFSYEVSRALSSCEGVLLVVDAAQGVEAQTIANVYMAIDHELAIVPVLNKIDLPAADPEKVREEIEDFIGIDASEAILASSKTGEGTKEILEAIIKTIPPPEDKSGMPLRALVFDSWYDNYRGAMALFRVFEGTMNLNDKLMFMGRKAKYEADFMGYFSPTATDVETLYSGEVGFISGAIKTVSDIMIGDTITSEDNPAEEALPGFKAVKPVVFCGMYPVDSAEYESLRDALEKLTLNDSSIHYEAETSSALGFGFRCGFLGLLHMDVTQERLEREFNLNLITTAPSVIYRIGLTDGTTIEIDNPSKLPPTNKYSSISEPFITSTVIVPTDYVGKVIQLLQSRRGVQKDIRYLGERRAVIEYYLPMGEVVTDFYNKLKSQTKGYASFDYEFFEYRQSNLVKLDIMINKDIVDALAVIVHKDNAYYKGRDFVDRLKTVIPRQMFDISIQSAIGTKIIASTRIGAFRKNVTAKCYGGDVSRKRKLLEKQKAGKKRMKSIGSVEIPQEAFLSILTLEDDAKGK